MEDQSRHDPAEPETAYELLQRGQSLLEGRHHAQAAIARERADRLEPGKGSILEALGRAYYNSGQAERAAATFEALLDIDPSSHFGHFGLGQSLKRLGRRSEAATRALCRHGACCRSGWRCHYVRRVRGERDQEYG
jgi:tetratricopeptide (TPR) repeat protein